ncbi:polysaccharide (de)acetylase [Flavobacterium sp. DGU11]|uniref:Polysaccharide (De)acetylase n=1 Tax=Flavobacterium arundinis TaxID=3139143 RepID=A0ABU9HUK9_9FLAO
MLNKFKSALNRSLTNSKGWKTSRKIVVIDSDDWGSIRMPNKEVRDAFQESGYNILSNPYCKYDTLANTEDLDRLFSVLLKFKDKNGNHPVFTANTVVANPDFGAIKQSGFTQYSYKPFTTTLKEYYPDEDVFGKWHEGMNANIFRPQYHGREHLNVPVWLEALKGNNKIFIDAFEAGFWGVPKNLHSKDIYNVQAAYSSDKADNIAYYKKSIQEGLNLFEEIFNFRSKTFIANNYTWSPELNATLLESGVTAFQSMKYQKIPDDTKKGGIRLYPVSTGKKNELGQIYLVRNCLFEPSQMSRNFDNVGSCIKDIENSFFFKKPAIIASHRLNFIGAIAPENREQNLAMLHNLLERITNKWPDAEFMSSDQLADIIHNGK